MRELSAEGVLEHLGASALVMDRVEEAIARLRDGDPKTRGEAAMWLATNGDARAFAALEHVAILDNDTYDGGRELSLVVACRSEPSFCQLTRRHHPFA